VTNVRVRAFLRNWSDEDLEGLLFELREKAWTAEVYGPTKRFAMIVAAMAELRRRGIDPGTQLRLLPDDAA